jgi:multiple sugar transport system ATP-binding protein
VSVSSIEFEKVSKRFGEVVAVDELTIEIPDGEFMIFVGPSGCGKTTALRMVAGLEEISSGTIRLGSHPINDIDPAERDIAMVFQNYALYPHMTVAANLGFPLRMRRRPKAEITARVDEVAQLLGIEALLARKPRELSGGQRQRVAMGRSIVRHPQAFLMDEPLSNLDAKLRVQMRAELVKLHRTLGVTTIYVTHDQTEAMTLGQRVTVLDHGVVQQVAPPQELYDWPANSFVASFIGSPPMNFVGGVVESGDVRLGRLAVALPADVHARLQTGSREVTVGLRPESFLAETDMAGESREALPRLRGRVEIVEQLGSESFVYFRTEDMEVMEVGDRPLDLKGALCARLRAGARYLPGDPIELAIDPACVRLFDNASGSSLLAERERAGV